MADDYSIRAKITGDASSFKVAMDGAALSAEASTARIKKALEEAKVEAANYANSIRDAQSLLASGFGSNPAGGGASIVSDIKSKLAESEAGFAATKTKIAELQAELKGVPAASAEAASGIGLTEKQLALMATAAESAARQLRTLPVIQEEVAARVNASVAEMAAFRKRVDAEAAQSAKILGAVQVSGVVESGDPRGQIALTAATEAHVRALSVQQEVQARQAEVTAEVAAREELLARATAQSTTATLADAEAQVQAAIAKEGSAAAALKLADAQEATLSGAQKQAAAIANANQIIQRSATAVAGLQAEVANQAGVSADRMATYAQRAAAEVQKANAAIKESQIALGEAIVAGDEQAIASMAGLQAAAEGAAAVLAGFKSQQADIVTAQAAAAEAAAAQASALDVVTEVITAAAARGQNYAAVQQEIAASVGKTSIELEATYVRAAAAAREATSALIRDAEKLGPAIQQSLPGATAALANLRTQMQQTRAAADELAARIKLVQLAETESTPAAQANAMAQYEVAIAEKGSAVAALEAELAARKLAAAEEQVSSSSNVARVGIAELTGSTQGMIFALSRVAASIPSIQTALQYAFPVITAIAFIEILGEMVSKLDAVAEAFYGFGAEEKKRIEDVNHAIQDSFAQYLSLRDKISETHSIGLTGIPKLSSEAFEATNKLQVLTEQAAALEDKAKSLQHTLDETNISKQIEKHPFIPAPIIAGGELSNRALGAQISPEGSREDVEKKLTQTRADQRKNKEEQDKLEVDLQARKYEIQEAGFHKSIELQEQELERTRNLAVAKASEAKKHAQELLTDEKINQDQATTQQISAENDRYVAEQRYAAQHDALQRQLEAKGEVPHYIDTAKDQQKAALDHQGIIDDLETKNNRAHKAELKAINEAHLKDLRDYARQVDEAAPEGRGKRAELAYLQSQQTALQKTPTEKAPEYQKSQEFLGTEIPKVTAQAAKETETEVKKSVNEQYEAWIESGERTTRDIQKYWTDIRTQYSTTSASAASNASIVEEADKRIAASSRLVQAEQRKVAEEIKKQDELYRERALNSEKANIQSKYITTPQASLNPFAPTPDQKEKQELGQVDLQAIQSKITSVSAQMKVEEDANRTEGDNYQKLITKKLALDNEFLNKSKALENEALKDQYQNYLKYTQQITSAFLKGTNEWLFSQKTFGAAMMDAWKGIVTSVVQDIEQITAKYIEDHYIKLALEAIFHLKAKALSTVADAARAASATTANASILASTIATNAAITTSNAGVAAGYVAANAAINTVAIGGNAARVTAGILANEALSQSYAGLAGVTEFAYALASTFGDIPAATALAAAAVGIAEGFSTVAALDTGGFIPKQGMAMLHPGEVVVNHPVTSLLSNIAARGGVGGDVGGVSGSGGSSKSSGPDVHLHMHTTVQALDNNGMDRVLDNHGKTMMRYFKAQMRSGRFA